MASPQVTLRIPPALLALIDAECDRRNLSRTDVILDALADQAAPLGAPGRGARAMEAAGVMQWDPSQKRPQYQKGQGAQGKAKGRR